MLKDQKAISSYIRALRKGSILDQGGEARTCGLNMCGLLKKKLGFPGSSDGKASAYNVGDLGRSLGQEDPLEKEMATHSSILGVTKSRT